MIDGKLAEFIRVNPPHPPTHWGNRDPFCPVAEFELEGHAVSIDRKARFAHGSDSDVYRTLDGSAIVKVMTGKKSLIPTVWRDEAALIILAGLGVAPHVLVPSYPRGIARECALRTLTMEYAGESNLIKQFDAVPGAFSPEVVLQIGIRLITLIEGVHSTGLVHGDIHGGNIVGTDPESLNLIDFGRARPFVDGITGDHVPLTKLTDELVTWNPVFLSINELDGWTVSRRDDLFRVAEVLVFLLQDDRDLYSRDAMNKRVVPSVEEMAVRKRNRVFAEIVPKRVVDLYTMAMDMDFETTPDYNAIRSMLAASE